MKTEEMKMNENDVAFETWWMSEGQYLRAAGQYEKTLAYGAWNAWQTTVHRYPTGVVASAKTAPNSGWINAVAKSIGSSYAVAEETIKAVLRNKPAQTMPNIPEGWKLVPVEPTERMIIDGFESAPSPNPSWTPMDVWDEYEAMSGCEQAAFRAKLCWAAMLASAPAAPAAPAQTDWRAAITKAAAKVLVEDVVAGLAEFKAIDYIKTQEALDAYVGEHTAALMEEIAEMLAALQGVVRVADRATVEFDAARAAIAKATNSVRH